MKEKEFPYDDILRRPHPLSKHHPQMPLIERAAQFSPFAALRGYEDAILESGRFTERRPELSEDTKRELDEKLQMIFLSQKKKNQKKENQKKEKQGEIYKKNEDAAIDSEHESKDEREREEIEISYFEADPCKEGGRIRTIRAIPLKIDEINGILVLEDKTRIPLADIVDIRQHFS